MPSGVLIEYQIDIPRYHLTETHKPACRTCGWSADAKFGKVPTSSLEAIGHSPGKRVEELYILACAWGSRVEIKDAYNHEFFLKYNLYDVFPRAREC